MMWCSKMFPRPSARQDPNVPRRRARDKARRTTKWQVNAVEEFALEMQGIVKEFPGVKALDGVDFRVVKGHVHGLVGENGAGKSTLMKVLSGVYPHGTYRGAIRVFGSEVSFRGVRDSEDAGIGLIHQERMLFQELSVAENITMPTFTRLVSRDKMYTDAKRYMDEVGFYIDPETLIKHIGVAKQQLVEIAKALSLQAKILILDEPTAALTDKEIDALMDMLNRLRDSGVTSIYISHKLDEVMRICDEVTVLRDGRTIGTKPIAELDEKKIISMMVGRDMSNRYPPKAACATQEKMLEVKNLNLMEFDRPDQYILQDINFHVNKGEVLGIAGLMGAGRTELVNSLFGDFQGRMTGEIYIDGKRAKIRSTADAIALGMGLATEDRKFNGLNLDASVEDNLIIASVNQYCCMGVIRENQAIQAAGEMVRKTKTKTPSLEALVMNLSGGNQQKVVVGKWLLASPKVLIFDEPTRGIDVGAKYEIYTLINELKQQGMSIIMVSSELPEVLGVSDRIMVLRGGQVSGFFDGATATEVGIMEVAT